MNLDQKLEMARVRAEKEAGGFTNDNKITRQLKAEMQKLEEEYGKDFAQAKRTFDGLVSLEDFYDSVEEQLERRDDYIKECEEEIKRLNDYFSQAVQDLEQEQLTGEELKECYATIAKLERQVQDLEQEISVLEQDDPLEKHLKSTAWNLNRIANVLEEQFALSDSQSILAQLRSKGGRKNG